MIIFFLIKYWPSYTPPIAILTLCWPTDQENNGAWCNLQDERSLVTPITVKTALERLVSQKLVAMRTMKLSRKLRKCLKTKWLLKEWAKTEESMRVFLSHNHCENDCYFLLYLITNWLNWQWRICKLFAILFSLTVILSFYLVLSHIMILSLYIQIHIQWYLIYNDILDVSQWYHYKRYPLYFDPTEFWIG